MYPHVSIFYDFEEEIIFTSGNDEVDLDSNFDNADAMMVFDLCIPFGTELFPHHGDSILQDLSTVLPASKETYQKQASYYDGTKSFKFSDHVLHLDDITSATQFSDLQLFHVQSVLVKFDDSQFTCKGSKTWTLLKAFGVPKFVPLVIIDHGERLTCFPFDRGKMDCYLFSSGPPCLQATVICVKTSQSRFSQIQNIEFDWTCNMYGIVRNKFLAIPSTFGKEGVMIMYVVDIISLCFGLITGLAICKAHIFGDNDLVVPSSTLLYFGLLKIFILSPCLIAIKFFGCFQMMDYGEQNPADVLSCVKPFSRCSFYQVPIIVLPAIWK